MLAFVMLFVQQATDAGERDMRALATDLIGAVLEHQGCYYLPHRLHATPEQLHRAYPQGRQFFELKRKYDPAELFQNRFYIEYGPPADERRFALFRARRACRSLPPARWDTNGSLCAPTTAATDSRLHG